MNTTKGRILVYCPAVSAGLIVAENRSKYTFSEKSWRASTLPSKDQIVVVTLEAERVIKVEPENSAIEY